MSQKIKIPGQCMFCFVPEDQRENYPLPLHPSGYVGTQVNWAGQQVGGKPPFMWTLPAGQVPSLVAFPHVLKFVPTECWCPSCLVTYHIGPPHPAEDLKPESLVVVP
jgi:hypothetical protein